MLRIVPPLAVLCLLAACAAEPVPEPPLPLPPPAPPRAQVQRAAPAPRPQPAANGDVAAAAAVAAVAPQPVAEPAWRVARDGIVGCANRASLAVLDQGAEGAPRLLAEARASGGCRTTFRVNEWAVETSEGDAVRLRLTNGAALTLWFRRGEVIAP